MNNPFIKQVAYQAKALLSIERDMSTGREIIIIEGVRYDAELFRTMVLPNTDMLYAFRRDGDSVCLTKVHNVDEAKKFFDETLPPSAEAAFPQIEEHDLGEEDQEQGDEDGL